MKLERCFLDEFQPALPMRGVTRAIRSETPVQDRFQPALPMRGVTVLLAVVGQRFHISTRTPHAGSDRNIMRKFTASINI